MSIRTLLRRVVLGLTVIPVMVVIGWPIWWLMSGAREATDNLLGTACMIWNGFD